MPCRRSRLTWIAYVMLDPTSLTAALAVVPVVLALAAAALTLVRTAQPLRRPSLSERH